MPPEAKTAEIPAIESAGAPCRFCGAALTESFADLGVSPASNAYLAQEDLQRMEPFYPLHAFVCGSCFLVQLDEFQSPEQLFGR